LRPGCPLIYNQGQQGSCTAQAIAAAVDFERKRQGLDFMWPSREFIYWNERALEGSTSSDSGAMIRDGFKVITHKGVCTEQNWPYKSGWHARPPKWAFLKARHQKTLTYLSIQQQQIDMLDCLAQGFPFVFGITVYDSFESDAANATGNVPMPGPTEAVLGGHALLAVGYESVSRIRFRNSWGEEWGDAGYGTIPIHYLTNPNLASDFWTVRLEE
jgi:C1A family cysteine protease